MNACALSIIDRSQAGRKVAGQTSGRPHVRDRMQHALDEAAQLARVRWELWNAPVP